jgi:diguanylate cyclase (GGDEF)-like protein/PAS domain S-box-containing protein
VRPLILVTDDEPTNRLLLRECLDLFGFDVVEAANGLEAVHTFSLREPSLVIMDVRMPRMDGYKATAAIRSLPGGDTVPILMLTALEDVETIRQAYEAGATDFTTKPFNVLVLGHRVQYLIRARLAMEALRRSEERLAEAQRNARLGHWDWQPAGQRMSWSPETRDLLGIAPDGTPSLPRFLERLHPEDRERARDTLQAAARGEIIEGEDLRAQLPDGTLRHIHLKAVAHRGAGERSDRVSGTVQDITERKEAEQRIRFLAYYDGLTRLPNRTLFMDRLSQAMDNARRTGTWVAIFFLDLDRFKHINDTYGHTIGDMMLKETAERLRIALRSSDCVARGEESLTHMVARLGGDEFLLAIPGITRGHDAARIAQRILTSLEEPFHLEGHDLFISGSIGISLFPNDGEDVESLLKNADAAMYQAKQGGRNLAHFYDHHLHDASVRKLTLETRLRRAIEREEMVVYYQPVMDLQKKQVMGAEALVRWKHPEEGLLAPAHFIEIAEESGLIVMMGEWILRTALEEARRWPAWGRRPFKISVNLSARQFRERRLSSQIRAAVMQSGVNTKDIELELTESALMYNTQEAVKLLSVLREMGLGIALDDFGTGYSSLSYLLKFPISALKIDRLFVKEICQDARSAALTRSIISMARGLDLDLIAEGVETQQQADELSRQGCRLVQGYLFGKPMPAEEFRSLIEARGEDAAETRAATL